MLKNDFNKVAKQNPLNSLHIFRTPFPKNIYGRLLLNGINFYQFNPFQANVLFVYPLKISDFLCLQGI